MQIPDPTIRQHCAVYPGHDPCCRTMISSKEYRRNVDSWWQSVRHLCEEMLREVCQREGKAASRPRVGNQAIPIGIQHLTLRKTRLVDLLKDGGLGNGFREMCPLQMPLSLPALHVRPSGASCSSLPCSSVLFSAVWLCGLDVVMVRHIRLFLRDPHTRTHLYLHWVDGDSANRML